MSIFDKFFKKEKINSDVNVNINNSNFNFEDYSNYNDEKIAEFKSRYDLTTVDGIRRIPVEEARRYPDGGQSVVYMPEQILNRQATEYKKENKLALAIECLRKANELYPHSFYFYKRDDYERLVEFLILDKRYDEAKKEHNYLNSTLGSRIDELNYLQQHMEETGTESKEHYYERVIKPAIEEEKHREEYYWLLENYPNIAPKSFGGYRKMKNMNSENYKKLVMEVSKNGYNIDLVTFWK